jgi:regulator of RNase E activity RraA
MPVVPSPSDNPKSMGAETPKHIPPANIKLPVRGPVVNRVPLEMLNQLRKLNTASICATLDRIGIRQTYMDGPTSRLPGQQIVGTAITLQFMPSREDITKVEYYGEKTSALWEVLGTIETNDILVIQASDSPYTGCVGEMLATYFKGRGGVGMFIDGYLRDWPSVKSLDLPIWSRGSTPHHASQGGLYPWAYNVPVNACNVLVLPGDIIMADDDGGVVIPVQLAQTVIDIASHKEGWEEFSRQRLLEGGDIKKYYPLIDEKWGEYEAWCEANKK